jgi:hypothetical protein
VRKGVAVGVLVLGTVLLAAIAPRSATPDAPDRATSPAGVEVSTAPPQGPAVTADATAVGHRTFAALRPLLAVLQVLLALAALWVAATRVDVPGGVRALRLRQAGVRRGPPAPVLAAR